MGKYDRHLTKEETEECKSDTLLTKDEDYFTQMFEYIKKLKVNGKRYNAKVNKELLNMK